MSNFRPKIFILTFGYCLAFITTNLLANAACPNDISNAFTRCVNDKKICVYTHLRSWTITSLGGCPWFTEEMLPPADISEACKQAGFLADWLARSCPSGCLDVSYSLPNPHINNECCTITVIRSCAEKTDSGREEKKLPD
jgi:hypothetical protein